MAEGPAIAVKINDQLIGISDHLKQQIDGRRSCGPSLAIFIDFGNRQDTRVVSTLHNEL